MKSSVVIKGITLIAALSVLGRGASARWLSPDPLYHTLGKEALERPFDAANPYTYVGNNPINATDPSGLCPWCLVGLGAAALLFIQNDVDANIAPAIALTPPGAIALGAGMFADATDQIGQLDRQRAALLAVGNTGPASEARLAALDAGIREAGAQAFFGLATAGVGAGPLREAGAARSFGGLSRAAEFGIKPYGELTGALRGTGLQAHHLIEQRFGSLFGLAEREGLSVAVTPAEHQAFTNTWRQAFPYGAGTQAATREAVMSEATRIYADYPAILRALGP